MHKGKIIVNRLLIIDDDIKLLNLLKNSFENENYIVQIASSGHEGIDLIKKSPSDIVITDLFMPDMNGIEIIKQIKELFPTTHIIIISGEFNKHGINYDKIALHSGAEYAIDKPIDLDKLFGIVEYMLAN